ncbi:ABC transporter substrate-binding protein [Quisquiliibacterium transsilvanicum]|uniref:ABC-type branched-subunit amino acid transport system substrate-binding protein n=1 Tax=Quisquiliibacterium transsilvanicum TaxID=1549638 RepID=A0A7W8HF68_9BURK|nr:ABC transporter substrate-binding protein [Quisquiliibacterium transsilvanicum]MBB5270366.1 ABC-type branched-subunit amino acid transport system substrate-binding protein [Quisquiliibacterium transsilvanicum]
MMRFRSIAFAAALGLSVAGAAHAQKKYDPGASDTEIKLGQTMPYSGPASAYGAQGKSETAYFKMVNARGGINGRKITFISLDDGYSPPKTVEQTRKLVEEDQVLALVNSIGTPTNTAVHKYLNQKKVPQLLVSTGAAKWNDAKNFPWTTPGYPPYEAEARVYAKHILASHPDAKIGLIYQNDDFGKDYLKGFKEALGPGMSKIVKEVSYEISDPTVDSQIIALKSSGANVLFTMTTPKFGAQVIRRVAELGWKPAHYIVSVSASQSQALEPAGLQNAVGLITASTLKEPSDPTWDNDPGMLEYRKFMKEWFPDGDPNNTGIVLGFVVGQLLEHILKGAGDNLTRENLMKQATDIRDLSLPLLLPGVTLTVTPQDLNPFHTFRTMRFDGKRWVLFGDPIAVGR